MTSSRKSDGGGRDEFYVGYLEYAPPGMSRLAHWLVVPLLLAVTLIAGAVAVRQSSFLGGTFEFGVYRSFEGVLYERPVPFLRVTQTGDADVRAFRNLLLVGFGKFGLPAFARGHHGEKVRFRGSLVHFGPTAMVEMNDEDSFEALGVPLAQETRGTREDLGDVTLVGELVDTKCYLGVMRPATGKVHRACAANCLAGGVPPGLLVRDDAGAATVFLLAGGIDDEPLAFEPGDAGLVMTAEGRLELEGDLPVLRVRSLRRGFAR